jgi:ubiquinone/menaquinone biosynthesis C-methylase UbiE
MKKSHVKNESGFQLSGEAPDLYEKVMAPLWFGRWADALLELVSLSSTESVLDVACGTGVTTRMAKRAVGPDGFVVGLDVNGPMLVRAR